MIKWPTRALKAVRKLFEPLQDIDIYVEDKNDEVFYTHLFKRISCENLRITRVFAKDGRKSVIDAAIAHNQGQRRALFLIDGDLEFVKGLPPPTEVFGLYRLDAYCIENFLICEKGAATILMEEATLSEEDSIKTLDYSSWFNSIQAPLVNLFKNFALLNSVDPKFQTISEGVGNLCSIKGKNTTELDINKVNSKILTLLQKAEITHSKIQIADILSKIEIRVSKLEEPIFIVSGKDFLLPLLHFHLSNKGCKIRRSQLRFKLALKFDSVRLNRLRQYAITVAHGNSS